VFNLEQSIGEWRQQMAATGLKNGDLLDELENHLREAVERQTNSGAMAHQAFETAVARMGQAIALNIAACNCGMVCGPSALSALALKEKTGSAGHCNVAVPPRHRGEGVLISKQTSLADWLRRNICITFGICMHPIACTVNDGCGDKHERVPVKRV